MYKFVLFFKIHRFQISIIDANHLSSAMQHIVRNLSIVYTDFKVLPYFRAAWTKFSLGEIYHSNRILIDICILSEPAFGGLLQQLRL